MDCNPLKDFKYLFFRAYTQISISNCGIYCLHLVKGFRVQLLTALSEMISSSAIDCTELKGFLILLLSALSSRISTISFVCTQLKDFEYWNLLFAQS